jgi:Mg-chelatase subunit ChlD
MAHDMREWMQPQRLPSGVFFNLREHETALKAKNQQKGVSDVFQCRDFRVAETHSTTSPDNDQRLYLPLLEVSLDVKVVATTARTRLTQTFTNHSTSLISEATYCFPLYDGSVVHEFRCWIGNDKFLQGKIKPKDTARVEYQEARSRQRVAVLLEEHTPEVFETSIGNIPSQTTVKVEILYITELKADLGGDGVLVTIPTSVAPRYGTPPAGYSLNSSIGPSTTPTENGLKIQVEVSAPHPIRKLESRTHPISVELGAEGQPTSTSTFRDLAAETPSAGFDPTKARANLSDRSTSLGKDFALLILSSGPNLLASRALIESHPTIPDHSAMTVTITPQDLFASDLSLNDIKAEIVFVADRSGSMQDKLEGLKTAMRVFLKSIPEKCYFNICSFGSRHSMLCSRSQPCSQENVEVAYQHVSNSFQADMGGTELLSALESVVQQRTTEDLNTQIIVLTDGQVWDTENTIDFVRKTRTETAEKVCFFALGIGDAVSHRLVEGIGREGGGLAEVVAVDAPGRWQSRVIRMLKGALTPSRWQCEITLGDGSENSMPLHNLYSTLHQGPSVEMPVQAPPSIQTPYRVPTLHAFSRFSLFFLLNRRVLGGSTSIAIQATAATGEKINVTLPLEHVQTDRPTIHFLAAKSLLNDLETGQSWLHDDKFMSYRKQSPAAFEQAIRQEGESIGVQWSIVGNWTSFVAVDTGGQIENIIRLYRAERSELADLTKPRYYATSPLGYTRTNSKGILSKGKSFHRPAQPDNDLHNPSQACLLLPQSGTLRSNLVHDLLFCAMKLSILLWIDGRFVKMLTKIWQPSYANLQHVLFLHLILLCVLHVLLLQMNFVCYSPSWSIIYFSG